MIRIYLDYFYKKGKISWEEKEKLKSIFRIKNRDNRDEYEIDEIKLFTKIFKLKEGSLCCLVLELLLYSGLGYQRSLR